MAITFTNWEVTSVKTKDETNTDGATNSNAIVQTYWKVTGTDENGNTADFSGATPFTSANVAAGDFVAFADLTEATVLGWIQSVVVGDYEAHIKEQMAKQIDQSVMQEPILPWATAEEVPPASDADPE